jgi:hypothetical protein
MGSDFRAPPARDLRQWVKVAVLFSFGYRFDWDRELDQNPGARPAELRELEAFLVARAHNREQVRGAIRTLVSRPGR